MGAGTHARTARDGDEIACQRTLTAFAQVSPGIPDGPVRPLAGAQVGHPEAVGANPDRPCRRAADPDRLDL